MSLGELIVVVFLHECEEFVRLADFLTLKMIHAVDSYCSGGITHFRLVRCVYSRGFRRERGMIILVFCHRTDRSIIARVIYFLEFSVFVPTRSFNDLLPNVCRVVII